MKFSDYRKLALRQKQPRLLSQAGLFVERSVRLYNLQIFPSQRIPVHAQLQSGISMFSKVVLTFAEIQ